MLALSILHLTEDRHAAIAKAHGLLRPGSVFAGSTVCLEGRLRWFSLVAPPGARLGLIPHVEFLDADELEQDIVSAGFDIGHRLEPENSHALFVIARKRCRESIHAG